MWRVFLPAFYCACWRLGEQLWLQPLVTPADRKQRNLHKVYLSETNEVIEMTTTDSWKENVRLKNKTDKTLVLVQLSCFKCSPCHQVAIHFHQQLCILLCNNRRKYAFSLILQTFVVDIVVDRQSTWIIYIIINIIYYIELWIICQFVCVLSWDKASCSNFRLMQLVNCVKSWIEKKTATWRMQISIRWAASNSQALEVSQASWRRRNSAALSVSASQSVGPCNRKCEPRDMPVESTCHYPSSKSFSTGE